MRDPTRFLPKPAIWVDRVEPRVYGGQIPSFRFRPKCLVALVHVLLPEDLGLASVGRASDPG